MYKNEVGGFVLRLVLGGIFLLHGIVKFKEGISETITRFHEYGIPYAEIVGFGVAGIEVLGGFFLIIGFSVRFVSFLLISVMAGAIVFVHFEDGFLNGYEFNVALIAMALYLLFAGSNMMSLDQLFNASEKSSKGKIQFRG
ncbi:DoxX family protein [Ureibacillus chungkukjangi]|uniref:Putative membrane protein YphA (DoxX/SURF4 family) n=1 Tax=Ureibacillus chungkukjangi TaxID=1202712 RepID=A0A318TPU9_9BACL|nr:DoxX family protein [Ureibacillus chungkukjangi]PYF06846.1 putative membrane protein YphA (DoxX/SURF4 family) [Ureibacillus chungkukjangi]